MDGRIMLPGGVPVKSGNRRGFVFRRSPEAEAFNRWQRGEFKEIEEKYAQSWREAVSNLDLDQMADLFRRNGIDSKTCKSLEDAYNLAHQIVSSPKPYDQMALAVLFLQIPREYHQEIVKRWQITGLAPIEKYAPYAAFVLKVELFFQIAVAASLISAARPSNRVDIAYLFYLPFCMMFVSSDKLHQRCAPLFLRPNQGFVWGQDLKADLRKLDARYSGLPQETKNLGVLSFASTPPHEEGFLTTQLWDRHMSGKWRDRPETTTSLPDSNKGLLDELKKFNRAKPIELSEVDFDAKTTEAMSIQRMVRRQKGKWLQVPKDLEDNRS
jgi:hypothetical protein